MPIIVLCPTCGAKLSAPDTAVGKKVRCPKEGCGTAVPVTASATPAAKVVERKPAPKSIDDEDGDEKPKIRAEAADDEEEVRPKYKFRRDESDDDEDDRPKSKRKRDEDDEDAPKTRRRRQYDDDDDDDFDERPRRKRRKKSGSGGGGVGKALLLALGGILGLAALGGAGFAVYALVGTLGWVEYKSDQCGFKAMFPTTPKEQNMNGVRTFEAKAPGLTGEVFVLDLDVRVPANIRKIEGENAFRKVMRTGGIKELSKKDATLAGQPATEFLMELPAGLGGESIMRQSVARVLVTENRIYIAVLTSAGSPPRQSRQDRFFNSFTLLK